jgi:hypothetical protein
MVYLRINISEKTNKIINAIKAEHGFKNKGQVINFVAEWYENKYLKTEREISYKNLGKKYKEKDV